MRFTLEPVGDLEVPDGATLADCRAGLVVLAGAALDAAPLTVDGRALAPDHVAGAEPWVAGCLARVGPGPEDPVLRAARAPWHLAVVAGPDAGAVAVPDQRGVLRVGRATGPDGGPDRPDLTPGHLRLTDPAVSRTHLVLHRSRGSGPARWRVHDDGSANGTLLRAGGSRARAGRRVGRLGRPDRLGRMGRPGRLGRMGRRLDAGDRLEAGSTTLELRRHPGAASPARVTVAADRLGPWPTAPAHRPVPRPAAPVLTWAVPLVGAAVLLAITRSPVALVLAVGAVAPALPALLAMRRRHGSLPGPLALADDPAATAIRLAAGPEPSPPVAGDVPPVVGAVPPDAGDAPSDGVPTPPPWTELARAGLAVVGPRPAALATVHGLLGAAMATDSTGALALTVLHAPSSDADWAWCRWLGDASRPGWPRVARDPRRVATVLAAAPPPTVDGPPGAPRAAIAHLVVDDGGGPWRAAAHRWWSTGRGQRDGVILVTEHPADVPAWCRWVLRVGPGGATLLGPGGPRTVTVPVPRAGWIEEQARRVAARAATRNRGLTGGRAVLPTLVGLADLGLPDDAASVRRSWSSGTGDEPPRHAGLVARIGIGTGAPGDRGTSRPGGPAAVDLDLIADGPHMLVAGTTGAGKSELLQALVLSLALRHPPSELGLVLIDFKGGAGLGLCRSLPHVVGEVTDLDPVEAGRALEGLAAELRRRERLLAAHAVADLEELRSRTHAPPRLVVVVDELRALTEDLPDVVPRLIRLAAQGRSLGIHLVLATQRPAGVVDAQLRANVAIRMCLRVADPADSSDVVDAPDAAAIGPDLPGRAVLRCGPGPLRTVQTAWPALRPADRGATGRKTSAGMVAGPPGGDRDATALVRRAVPWSRWGEASTDAPATGHAEHVVAAVRAAGHGLEPQARLWCPPLPATLALADLPTALPAAQPAAGPRLGAGLDPSPGLPLGLVDRPERQEQSPLLWDPRSGPLLVSGAPRSGRTSALRTLAVVALERGWHVHAVVGRPDAALLAAVADHPGRGTVVGAQDPRRLARLLTLLAAPGRPPAPGDPAPVPRLLLVDDVDAVRAALGRLPRGAPLDLLDQAVRAGTRPGLAVAVTGAPSDLVRLLPLAGTRVVLAVGDPHDDALLGVPRGLAAGRGVPGRGVVLGTVTARCQVATADGPAGRDGAAAGRPGRPLPLRLAPLPLLAGLGPPGPGGVAGVAWLGPGGDDAAPVRVGLDTGLLVVGPAGSGRSTALAAVAAQLHAGSVLRASGAVTDPAALLAALDGARPGAVLVVDDLDLLVRAHPGLDDQLAAWILRAETDPAAPRVVAAVRTDRAAAAYRGAIAALRSCAPVLVLAPHTAGSTDVAGCDLWQVTDPAWPDHPGRGALVHRGRATPVQVASAPVRALPVAPAPVTALPVAPDAAATLTVHRAPAATGRAVWPTPGGGPAPA